MKNKESDTSPNVSEDYPNNSIEDATALEASPEMTNEQKNAEAEARADIQIYLEARMDEELGCRGCDLNRGYSLSLLDDSVCSGRITGDRMDELWKEEIYAFDWPRIVMRYRLGFRDVEPRTSEDVRSDALTFIGAALRFLSKEQINTIEAMALSIAYREDERRNNRGHIDRRIDWKIPETASMRNPPQPQFSDRIDEYDPKFGCRRDDN